MVSKYPNTTLAVILLLIAGIVALVLLGPQFKADPAQIAIVVGVLVVALQQVLALRTAEANGHRLTHVEDVAAAGTLKGQDNAERLDVKDAEMETKP
jgi:hypothetical protein